jgi:hypothetical protein
MGISILLSIYLAESGINGYILTFLENDLICGTGMGESLAGSESSQGKGNMVGPRRCRILRLSGSL